jgi:hypothetical protein
MWVRIKRLPAYHRSELQLIFEYFHQPSGKHRHAATPIEAGERTNLILWCRNSHLESLPDHADGSTCPAWCGWHRMQSGAPTERS